ncbi:hypothetical protein F5Y15DRAFT_399312 [Xylariaceae sp. FL0016]|nr:hypothetical protein F5Y15DRAFT_399312 [Xylariaceae sp. FL0016]
MGSIPAWVDLSTIPAGPPPAGVVPNFIDPESKSSDVYLAIYITLPVMILCMSLRAYARVRTGLLGLDDYISFAAATSSIATCGILMQFYSDERYGRHFWDLSALVFMNFQQPMKYLTFSMFLTLLTSTLMRLSLFTLFLRLFRPARYASLLVWIGIVVTLANWIVGTVLNGVFCIPHKGDGGWASPANFDRCKIAQSTVTSSSGVVGTVTDFYLMAIPLGLIWQLNLLKTRKAGAAAVFLTGMIAAALSIAGTVVRFRLIEVRPLDYTWVGAIALAVYTAKSNIGIACSCMPAVSVLFRGWMLRCKSAGASLKRYFSSLSNDSKLSPSTTEGIVLEAGPTQELPNIPKGTLSGLVSFFRRGSVSRMGTKPGETQVSTYLELQSVDYEYHAHIEGPKKSSGWVSGSRPRSSGGQ